MIAQGLSSDANSRWWATAHSSSNLRSKWPTQLSNTISTDIRSYGLQPPSFGSQCSKFHPKPVHFRRSYSRTRERWRPFFRPIKYLQYSPSGEMHIWNMYPPLVNVRARSSLITESSQYCSDRRRKRWRRRTFTLELSVLAGSCSRPRPRPTCTC